MVDKLNDAELYERIRLVLIEFIPESVSADDISPETRLVEDLNVNSARIVGLVLGLEDAFRINIEDGFIDTLKTVGDLVALVKARIA